MLRRLEALIEKEFIQLIRDRRTLIILLVAGGVELLLFAAAVNTDIKHIAMVVADQSLSASSRSYLNAFVESDAFDIVGIASDEAGLLQAIDSGQASLGLEIPPDFASRLAEHDASVLMLVDGSSAFTSQSAYQAAGTISQQYGASLTARQVSPLTADIQILYNPDLQDIWFVTPAFIALIFFAVAMNLTSLSVARERESGTIEALLVTPIRPIELMLGKTIPNLAVVFVMAFEMLVIATLVLGVPFRGNLLLFLVVCLITAGCGLALGLVISTVVQTQNQSMQLGSMVNVTSMFVGGVLFPAYALPFGLRMLGYLFPTTYFIPIARGMFLKGVGLDAVWPQVLALGVLLCISLGLASRLFSQSLD